MNVRPISEKKYNISKHRFRELYYFCLQYQEWLDELKYKTDDVSSVGITNMPTSHNTNSNVERLALRRAQLEEKCKILEQTAIEADPELYQYILKAVTNEGISYNYLKMVMNIPCCKNVWYDRRRKFNRKN